MRSLRIGILGTIIGMLVGVLSLAVIYAGLLLGSGHGAPPTAVIVSAVGGSVAAGALCAVVCSLVTGRERSILAVLAATGVASLIVLPGNYANASAVPVIIYATAVGNGLVVARIVGALSSKNSGSAGQIYS